MCMLDTWCCYTVGVVGRACIPYKMLACHLEHVNAKTFILEIYDSYLLMNSIAYIAKVSPKTEIMYNNII